MISPATPMTSGDAYLGTPVGRLSVADLTDALGTLAGFDVIVSIQHSLAHTLTGQLRKLQVEAWTLLGRQLLDVGATGDGRWLIGPVTACAAFEHAYQRIIALDPQTLDLCRSVGIPVDKLYRWGDAPAESAGRWEQCPLLELSALGRTGRRTSAEQESERMNIQVPTPLLTRLYDGAPKAVVISSEQRFRNLLPRLPVQLLLAAADGTSQSVRLLEEMAPAADWQAITVPPSVWCIWVLDDSAGDAVEEGNRLLGRTLHDWWRKHGGDDGVPDLRTGSVAESRTVSAEPCHRRDDRAPAEKCATCSAACRRCATTLPTAHASRRKSPSFWKTCASRRRA